jgi:diguanylate cyclase (GGDEF)-like protein
MSFYTEKKERSHRFVLALRMGLPIFLLTLVAFFFFINQLGRGILVSSLILSALSFLSIIVYFIFYLIYQSSKESITDPLTHTFTPDYFYHLYQKYQHPKTLVMISIDNLWSINQHYGFKNGDKILSHMVIKINAFFKEKGREKLIISRYRGGDFILLFEGEKESLKTLLEMFIIKYENYTYKDVEIRTKASLADSKLSGDFEMLINRLYEMMAEPKTNVNNADYSINALEKEIVDAIEEKRFSYGFWQLVGEEEKNYSVTVKLIDSDSQLIHQSRYIPVLNRLGLLRQFEMVVLENIGKLASEKEGNFIVSISAVTLRNPFFFEHAMTLFERYREARNRIVFMFEEKEYCYQLDKFKQRISLYRHAGYKLALDHLGGYHTAMLYLKEINVDFVRFDSMYTRHIHEEGYRHILQGLNLSAHLSGAKTWMGLIEDEKSDLLAQQLKINLRQGSYHGNLITPNELKDKHEIR